MTVSNLSTGGLQRALINGVVIPGLSFTRDISFATNSKVIRIVDTLQNTGVAALANVVTLDTADPDQDSISSGTSSTLNDVVSVNLNNDMVVATGPTTGLSVGFGSDSGLQIPSAVGFNNTSAYSYLTVVDPNGVSGDIDINLAQNYGTLAAGQSRSVIWYTVFGNSIMEVTNVFITLAGSNPPSITTQPASQTIPTGGSATFCVTATGSLPLSYFWMRNNIWIPGATNSSYTTNNVQLTDTSSQFSCLVSNAYGTLLSSNAVLTIIVPTSDWFTELFATTVTNLAFTSYTFTNNGSGNFYAVCSQSAIAFPTDPTGGTSLSLSDDSYLQITLSGTNTVAIYNNRTNVIYVGSNGYLTMNAGDTSLSPTYASHFLLPRVSAVYRDLNPGAGGSVTWKQLSDRMAVSYQGVPIFGGTSSQTNSFQVEMFFDGRIQITYLNLNTPTGLVGLSAGTGHATNFVASDFTTYTSCGPQPPVISLQPASQTIVVGSSVTFSVAAYGSAPLNYFWQRNGTPIPGGTNSTYNTNNVQLADNSSLFSCVVSNAYGTTNSQVATLTVVAIPPSITLQPQNQTVAVSTTANFTVGASGTAPLSYFWRRNGLSISGAISSSYNLTNAQVSDSGSQFSCVVTNIAGSVTSSVAVLKVDTTVANDQCSGALVVSGLTYTNAQYTTNATSTGDPVPDCVPGFGNGVWYRFTPAFSGQLEVDTFGSDFDTGLALYTGACGSWTQLACNDDTGGLTSQIITNVSAGTTYYILAGGYSGYTGHLLVHLALTLPVDHFAWNTIPSPKSKNVPFGVTITAQDVNNQAVANFTGTVMLGGRRGGSSIVFSATFDNGSDGFIYLPDPDASSNLWHSTTHRFVSPSNCQYYGKEGSWNYDTGARNAGNLQSPVISLAGAIAPVTLAFKYLLQTEGGTIWDQATVAISGDGGTTWSALTSTTNLLNPLVLTSSFTNRVVDISAYAGSNIVLRFNFDTIDAGANTFEGWYVDDVNVTATTAAVAITPTNTGSFINGVWAGNVAVLEAATNMYLVATDSLGRSGSSSPFQVVSNSVITQVTLLPGGSIQITLAGSSGDIYRVLGSTNLLNWQTIASVTNVTGTVQFTDPGATNFNRRFYRLVMP